MNFLTKIVLLINVILCITFNGLYLKAAPHIWIFGKYTNICLYFDGICLFDKSTSSYLLVYVLEYLIWDAQMFRKMEVKGKDLCKTLPESGH